MKLSPETSSSHNRIAARRSAYMMIECLVYIGALFVLLGAGYAALYRCIDSSVALRRNADDITAALHAGERWRADVRSMTGKLQFETTPDEQILRLPKPESEIAYRFSSNAVFRRLGAGPWVRLLSNVQSSAMESEARQNVTVCRWELEVQPGQKSRVSRLRPLFTFIAVPETAPAK